MNWRHFFGWFGVVLLIFVETAGMACLAVALRYNRARMEAVMAPKQQEAAPLAVEPDTISLVAGGDAMMHMPQLYPAMQADGAYNFDECFRYIAPLLEGYDLRVVNLETTLPGKNYSGYPCFGAPDAFLYGLQDAGFGTILMANNHCCDKGSYGIRRTLSVLDSLGLEHVGLYADSAEYRDKYPLMAECKGVRIAMLNFTYGTNGLPVPKGCVVCGIDTTQILEGIFRAREKGADIILAFPHWGEEYFRTPRASQRELAEWLLAHGVDHIIGSHPHVIEPVEVVEDSLSGGKHVVAYSLGNFISSQLQPERSTSLLVGLKWVKDEKGVRFVEHQVIQTWVSRPQISGHRQARIYPMNYPEDSLNTAERTFREACIEAGTF